MSKNVVLPPPTDETRSLMEIHRQLTAINNFTEAQELDTYSLAQPSPFRFVPSVASNGAARFFEGE